MSKRTILHIPSWYPNKDDVQLGIFIENQIELLNEEYNNIVLYIQGKKESKIIESNITIKNNITRIHITYPSGKNFFSKARSFLNSVTTGLSKLLELNKKIDLVHCHVAGKNLWIAQKYFDNLPCLLSEHWSGYLNGNFELQPKWKQKLILKRINKCDKIFAVSQHLKDAIIGKGITSSIEIIGNHITQAKPKVKKPIKENKILVVSDLDNTTKNISNVISAFKNIQKEKPKATLNIIGGGKDFKLITDHIKFLKLENSVFLLGRLSQEEVLNEYANYDLLIVNSWIETFSMVTLEALSSGIPVIATKCKGPEQFITSANGILIPLDQPEALTKAMHQVLDNIHKYDPEEIRNSVKHFISPGVIKDALAANYSQYIKH